MKTNPTKCHFICSKNNAINFIVVNQTIDNGKCEKLLGIDLLILTFNVYTDNIFRELELKLNVLLTNIIWEINHNLLIQM